MPRYSIQQRASMAGKKAQASAKMVTPAAPKPTAPAMAPEVKSRVNALTTPAKAYKEHHGLLRAVSNVLQRGLNDAQEAGGPASKELTSLHHRLHQASLHLDAHHSTHAKGHHEQAAGHLNIAADELGRVASQLKKHVGSTVRDADGSEFPLSFVSQIARDATKHYTRDVAGVTSPKREIKAAQFPVRDTHKIEHLDVDMSGGAEVRRAKVRKSELASSVLDTDYPGGTHTLEKSRYKNAMPMYPAKIQGPEPKGA